MQKRKYKILRQPLKKTFNAQIYEVYQIEALVDIPEIGVKKGQLGGWIDEYGALSHEGKCWIARGSIVANNSRVEGNALIRGNSLVFDHSLVRDESSVVDSEIIGSRIVQDTFVSYSKIEESYLSEKTKIRKSEVQKLNLKSAIVSSSTIRSNHTINAMYGNLYVYDSEFFYDGEVNVDIERTCNMRNCSLRSVSSFKMEKAIDIKNVNSAFPLIIKSTGIETNTHPKNTLGAFHRLTLEEETWIDVEDSIVVLDGTIKGLIRFRKCNIHNYGKVENLAEGGLLLHNCVVNDMCAIEKTRDSSCMVKGLVLSGEDRYLVD